MAMSQAANMVERVLGHDDNAITEQNVSNPARDRQKYGDPSGETMKALAWMGKNQVEVGTQHLTDRGDSPKVLTWALAVIVDTPKPRIIEDRDVILKVTGSTICGSDLHLYHGQSVLMRPSFQF